MFGLGLRLGFWLSRDGVSAALVRRRRKDWIKWHEAEAAAPGWRDAADRATQLTHAFQACLKTMPKVVRRADMPVALALPDSFVTEDVLSFAEFPSTHGEAEPLVRHRMARELGVEPDSLAVSFEIVDDDAPGTLVRIRSLDATVRDDIEAAAAAAGLRLLRIDGWLGFASRSCTGAAEGAALWVDDGEWALVCWSPYDPAGFSGAGDVDAADLLSSDVLRIVRTYARVNETSIGLTVDAPDDISRHIASQPPTIEVTAAGDGTHGADRAAKVASWL